MPDGNTSKAVWQQVTLTLRFVTKFTALQHARHLGRPRPPCPCARRCEQERCRKHVPPACADSPGRPWLCLSRLRALQCARELSEATCNDVRCQTPKSTHSRTVILWRRLSCTAAPDIAQGRLRCFRARAVGRTAGSQAVLDCD